MRLRVVILVAFLLAVAAVVASCSGNTPSDQSGSPTLLSGPGATSTDDTQGATTSVASTGVTATAVPPPAQGGIELPSVAPLNPAFLKSLSLQLYDASTIASVGHALGIRPLSQDFLNVQGLQVPSLGELGLPSSGSDQDGPETLPARYDLRAEGRVTPVGDQDPYGTCWSFATIGSLESSLLASETWDFSEDNMVLNSEYDVGDDPYNHGGNIQMSTAYLVRWGGPVEESSDAYGDSFTPAGLSPVKHVQEVNWIPARGGPLDNDNVKRAIMEYGGAYIALSWQGSASGSIYFNAQDASYYYLGPLWANHAVLVVGWDDDYPASNFPLQPPGDGAFIIKNSWGTSFGDDGYFYVSYYDAICGCTDVMAVIDHAESTDNYTGIYQYDPLGDINCLGYSSPEAWFANVFTAAEESLLSAVGFYTLTPGTSYSVYTGPSLADLASNTSGTLAYMGFHTVELPETVALASGQPFVVAVKVNSPGTDCPVAVEYPIENFSSAATAEPGQSWMSPDGTEWVDLTEAWDADANVCLKAYVSE